MVIHPALADLFPNTKLFDGKISVNIFTMVSKFYFKLTPFNLDGRIVCFLSCLVLATRILVVLCPLRRPTANSYRGAILKYQLTDY